jgi:hypothetical protein
MSTLAQQQQALLHALFAWPAEDASKNIANYVDDTKARGLKAYQTNGHVLAQRALHTAYPVLAQLLGDESFASLARAFWHACPPSRGDLAQWGLDLADFVQASEQLADEPYLPDVARAEWALHTSAACADHLPEPATFALLMAHDPSELQLVLAPGCAVLRSAWPVVSILTAHLEDLDGRPGFDEVGQKLREEVAEDAVVWRAGHLPRVRLGLPGEADLLTALLQAQSLDAALQAASVLDFNAWLPLAAQSGLLLAARHVGPVR